MVLEDQRKTFGDEDEDTIANLTIDLIKQGKFKESHPMLSGVIETAKAKGYPQLVAERSPQLSAFELRKSARLPPPSNQASPQPKAI